MTKTNEARGDDSAYIPTAEERETERALAAFDALPPAPVCINSQTHGPHRIAGTFRDYCPGYTEPRSCGRNDAHESHAWPDIHKGGTYQCPGLPVPEEEHREATTPAEARTGISDRTAAALADVAYLREQAQIINRLSDVDRFDRIERALRQQ